MKGADEDAKVNVYTTDGKLVRSAVKRNAALQGLPSGVYVVDGKKCVKWKFFVFLGDSFLIWIRIGYVQTEMKTGEGYML